MVGALTPANTIVSNGTFNFTINSTDSSDQLGGSGGLLKIGGGNLTLTGNTNTYSGITTVSAGTLTVSGLANNNAGKRYRAANAPPTQVNWC